MNNALDLDLDFDLATRTYRPTPPPQSAEEHARRMLARARNGLQVNQRQYEKAKRRGNWPRVVDLIGRIERAEQAVMRWQQELNRIQTSRGIYRFDDEMLDEATHLERGIHGYFPFPSPVGSRRERLRTGHRLDNFYDKTDLDAMLDLATPPPTGGRPNGVQGGIAAAWIRSLVQQTQRHVRNARMHLQNQATPAALRELTLASNYINGIRSRSAYFPGNIAGAVDGSWAMINAIRNDLRRNVIPIHQAINGLHRAENMLLNILFIR
jgi:hypothetical protein